jgi:2-oxoglutarate dehydrogenase E2 component (dihydrolipoamide succinyltransferase)
MPVSVTMPQLGESVTEGTVTRWLKKVGDFVNADEPLVEVSTDKVDTEIPAPTSGILLEIRAMEDDVVLVGGELAVIGSADESSAPQPEPVPAPAPVVPEPIVVEPVVAAPVATPAPAVVAPAAPSTGTEVVLPQLGESVTEGTITRWLKKVGDQVAADEPLVEISTDKVDTEIPSPAAGTLLEIRAAEDAVVPVGAVLAIIGVPGAAPAVAAPVPAPAPAPAPVVAAPTPAPAPVVAAPTPAPAHAPTPINSVEEPYLTPLVRKLASENGVDINALVGTGVGGRIRKSDVLAAAAAKAAPTPPAAASAATSASTTVASALRGTTVPMSRLRRVIAERMVTSLQTSAQLTTVVEVDMTRVSNLRNKSKSGFAARENAKLTFLPFFAKATVEALRHFPQLNASLNADSTEITYHDATNLGIAVDTERGLLVPVIRGAEDLTIAALARRIADVAERTRTNKVSPDELGGGTFTITNTGSRGALFDTPIINLPQVAILGTGAIVKRAVVMADDNGNDLIAVRSMAYLALSYDHRLVDGADAARFLGAIKQRLEEGSFEGDLNTA